MKNSEPTRIDSVEQISAAWIQSVLNRSGDYDSRVSEIVTTPIGAGNVSDTVRVGITYSGPAGNSPPALVVKLHPSNPDAHAHGLRSGAYHREVGAYNAISERNACRIPLKYWASGDETYINLVVEDLTATTIAGDQVAGCGLAEAESVVVELARLHSEFFPLSDDSAPAWLIRLHEVCEYWSEAAEHGARTAVARFTNDLTPEALATIKDAAALVRQWHRLPQDRLTMTHGDPRVDNILFEKFGDQVSAVMIDWQVTGLRNPMYDFGYFMSGSVGVEDRRAHEDHLLRRYIEQFSERASGYDIETATSDYQIQLLSGLFITLAAITVLPDNETVNRLILALLQRNCAAAMDWKSVPALRNLVLAPSIDR